MFLKFLIKRLVKIWQTQKLASFLVLISSLILSYFFGFINLPFILVFVAWFIFNWNTFLIAVASIFLIISIPILILLKLEEEAGTASVYTYFSLAALVVLEISRYSKVNLWVYQMQKWLARPNLSFLKKFGSGTKMNENQLAVDESPVFQTEFKTDFKIKSKKDWVHRQESIDSTRPSDKFRNTFSQDDDFNESQEKIQDFQKRTREDLKLNLNLEKSKKYRSVDGFNSQSKNKNEKEEELQGFDIFGEKQKVKESLKKEEDPTISEFQNSKHTYIRSDKEAKESQETMNPFENLAKQEAKPPDILKQKTSDFVANNKVYTAYQSLNKLKNQTENSKVDFKNSIDEEQDSQNPAKKSNLEEQFADERFRNINNSDSFSEFKKPYRSNKGFTRDFAAENLARNKRINLPEDESQKTNSGVFSSIFSNFKAKKDLEQEGNLGNDLKENPSEYFKKDEVESENISTSSKISNNLNAFNNKISDENIDEFGDNETQTKTKNLQKQEPLDISNSDNLKEGGQNYSLELSYFLLLIIFNIIIFSFRNGVAFTNWFPAQDLLNPSNSVLSIQFLTDRLYLFLVQTLNLDYLAVLNTFIQAFFVFIFFINYFTLRKIYTIFYKINTVARVMLGLISLAILYNPFTLQKIFEGDLKIIISQALFLILAEITLDVLISFARTKTVYLSIFLQKCLLFSLLILLIAYFNFELLFLILPVLLTLFGFLALKKLLLNIKNKQIKQDFYIKDSPNEQKIKTAFKLQFIVLIIAFNLGSALIFFTKMNQFSIRNSVFSEVLSNFSPTIQTPLDIFLALGGITNNRLENLPEIEVLFQSFILSQNLYFILYASLILFLGGLITFILGYHIFFKKRFKFLILAALMLLISLLNFGLSYPFGLVNKYFYNLSSSSYLLLENGSIWILLVILGSVILISKKPEGIYKNVIFGFLIALNLLQILPLFLLNDVANNFRISKVVQEMDNICNPSKEKVFVFELKPVIQSSIARYPDKLVNNYYKNILECTVYQPEKYIYRQTQEELKLKASDTKSFFLNKILEDYSSSNPSNRLSILKVNFSQSNIKYILVDTAGSKTSEDLALSLVLDKVKFKREGRIYVFYL
jgi:hypothetical protein